MVTEWLERSRKSIAQGCLTNSKKPESLLLGLYPTHIKYAHGCHITDTADKKYLDFICGLGANFFGYGNHKITEAVKKVLAMGPSHSLPTIHEVEAAEAVKEMYPFIHRVKFLKTGSDACNAAIKIARAYTGRELVLSEGYHGWGDDFVSLSEPAAGVPKRSSIKKFDWLSMGPNVAAVIIEPVETDDSDVRINFLKRLRQECDQHGTLLIYDEVITGLRYQRFAVAHNWGVLPDLICLGKAIGGGFPLSVVGGNADLMDQPGYFVSSTFAGEVLSLVACKEALKLIRTDHEYNLPHLWEKGKNFLGKFNENPSSVRIVGYPTRGRFVGDEVEIALYFQEMAKAGTLFCKSWFLNWDLIPHLDTTLYLSQEILDRVSKNRVKLEYPLPASPFAERVRRGTA